MGGRALKFKILHDGDEQEFYAYGMIHAAEKWAEWFNEQENYCFDSDEDYYEEIEIIAPDGERKKFKVSAYITINYRVKEIK